MTEIDTNNFVNFLLANGNAISALFTAVKTGRQRVQSSYNFVFQYTSVQNPAMTATYMGETLWYLYQFSQGVMAGFGPAALTVLSSGIATLPDPHSNQTITITLSAIDKEVIVLLAQMDAIASLYSATKYAQQMWQQGKTYAYSASKLYNLSGGWLPTVVYGTQQLIAFGKSNVVSNYVANTTI